MWRLNFRILVAVMKYILRLADVVLFMNSRIIKKKMLIWGNMLEKCWPQKTNHAKMKMVNVIPQVNDRFIPIKKDYGKSRIGNSASNHCFSRWAQRNIFDKTDPEREESRPAENLRHLLYFPAHVLMMNHLSNFCVCVPAFVETPSQRAFADPEKRIQSFTRVYNRMLNARISPSQLANRGFYLDNIGYVLCYWCHSREHIDTVLMRQEPPTHTPACELRLQPRPENYGQLLHGTHQHRLD